MKIKILIIGASGMLGSNLLKYFCNTNLYSIACTVRNYKALNKIKFNKSLLKIYKNIDADNKKNFEYIFDEFNPDFVINCIGVIKQNEKSNDLYKIIQLNSLLPHYLAKLAKKYNSRLLHFSTDCVFLGKKGNYKESDLADAQDFYGRSKLLGEVNYSNTITLRTSMIGHEIDGNKSLLEWFLSQNQNIKGYNKAIFSGFPTNEIARIIDKYIVSNIALRGTYHLSSNPISKYDLLLLIKKIYQKDIQIIKDENIKIDRSLNSYSFKKITGFKPKSWNIMIKEMKKFYEK
jgi:dTDP-4-dehydrorhamnose reductase